jgi:hypothetical protein
MAIEGELIIVDKLTSKYIGQNDLSTIRSGNDSLHGTYLPRRRLAVRKTEKKLSKIKTPIERIFHDIFNREMTAKERRVLLGVSKNARKTK